MNTAVARQLTSNPDNWIGHLSFLISALRYQTHVYGLAGVKAGFLIAFKHLIPEHELRLLGLFSLRVKVLFTHAQSARNDIRALVT